MGDLHLDFFIGGAESILLEDELSVVDCLRMLGLPPLEGVGVRLREGVGAGEDADAGVCFFSFLSWESSCFLFTGT